MTNNSVCEAPLNKSFLHALWALTRPYWQSEEKWIARGLLLAILALNLFQVYMQVQFNSWYNGFYNALQTKNYPQFQQQIVQFSWMAGIYILAGGYLIYLTMLLQMRWRRWLTEKFFDQWLDHRTYYRMELTQSGSDNPDQRLTEDIRTFTGQTLSLAFQLLRQFVTLVSFVGILWTLSGPLAVEVAGSTWNIPGYMLWAVLLYSIVGTWLTHKVGRPLTQLNFDQQRYEADLRFNLIRLRENAEGVALYAGETDEKRGLLERFQSVWSNWLSLMTYRKRLSWFTVSYEQAAVIFPFVVAAPRYFSGVIQLGELMQTNSAFGRVQDALSWFITSYSELAEWRASVNRLLSFHATMNRLGATSVSGTGITSSRGRVSGITAQDLALALPDGKPLIAPVSITLTAGQHTILRGPSGTGKSTWFRALAGIWPFGKGNITLPEGASILFLPQKPYLPMGSLRAVVSYPVGPGRFTDADIGAALEHCRLGHLVAQLDKVQSWDLSLSPGEQQRLAIARALLIRPDWLFMDEATAALDEHTERELYTALRRELPDTTLISIAHKPTVTDYHQYAIDLIPGPERHTLTAPVPL